MAETEQNSNQLMLKQHCQILASAIVKSHLLMTGQYN